MWFQTVRPQRRRFKRAHRIGVALFVLSAVTGVSADDFDDRDFDCLMEPKTRVMVGSPTQGVINAVKVRRGDFVKKGQVLATLDARLEQAQLEYARMRSKMDGEIRAREADLRLAEVTLKRVKNLHGQNLAPAQQRDEAQAALDVARMALQQARDNQQLNHQEYARVRELVNQHVIRSPISGVVVDQIAYPGEFVYENPLMMIAQVDPLKIEAILPARYFGQVKDGMMSKVFPEIQTSEPLEAPVSSVDQIIDSASGTFVVHLELANPDNAIPGGQRCRLAFGDVDPDVMNDRKAARR